MPPINHGPQPVAGMRIGAQIVNAAYLDGVSLLSAPYDIYVSQAGNDGWAGTQAAPLKTLAAAQSAALAKGNGVRIALQRDGVWREQITLNAINAWEIGAYGTGDVPHIRCDDVITSGSWSKTAGQTFVYQAEITLASINTIYTNVWESGTWMVRAASIAACDSTPGSYFLSEASVNATLYIHPAANDDPASSGKTYEYSRREYSILGNNATGAYVHDIYTSRNLSQNGSLFLGVSATVRNVRASHGNKHNLFVGDGSLLEDVLMDDAYYGTTQATLFVCYQNAFKGKGLTVRRSTCSMPSASTNIGGFLAHDSATTSSLGAVLLEDCICTNLATGFNIGLSTTQEIRNPTVTNCVKGINADANLTVTGGSVTCASNGQCVETSKNNVTVTLNGGTYNAPGGSANLFRSLTKTNSVLNLNGITMTRANGWAIQMTGTGAVLNANNNTFQSAGFGYYDMSQADATISSNNNAFGTVRTFRKAGTSYTSLAAWQSASSQDLASTQI